MTTYSNTPGALKTTFSPWLRSFNASGMLLPIVLAFLRPTWSFPSFSPRQPIYSNDLVPMIFAPWASPTSGLGVLSHFLQALLFWHLPASALIYCYPLWICISLVRTVLGHILSRSVGWAYPHLFSHWALYETSDGFGPALLVYLYLVGTTEVLKALPKLRVQFHEVSVMVALCTVLCWLDAAPWTYGVATVCAVILTLCRGVLRVAAARGTVHPMKLDGRPREGSPLRTRSLLGAATLSLLVITIPRVLFSFSSTPAPTFMPASPSPSSPLLEILVLTHPRPNVTAATTILTTTLDSYLPFANPNVALSVFTHSATHPAFAHARDKFSQSSIQFYADTDSHPDATSGQYLHLAEAFRWITEKGPYQAEWTMLVEDDFPVCEGERGWDAVKRVMTVLENGRAEKSKLPDRRGGFVGTGGRYVWLVSASKHLYNNSLP